LIAFGEHRKDGGRLAMQQILDSGASFTALIASNDLSCLGVMWWDATWTAVPGNGWDPFHPSSGNNWENQALFDYNNRALPAMNLFNQP
jgi:arabinogalactan endo-1,4-beta-galactosidase